MSPRICICCGEPMSERGNALSRNPNLCASCSSMADGIEEPGLSHPHFELPSPTPAVPPPISPSEVIVLEWVTQNEEDKRRGAAPVSQIS